MINSNCSHNKFKQNKSNKINKLNIDYRNVAKGLNTSNKSNGNLNKQMYLKLEYYLDNYSIYSYKNSNVCTICNESIINGKKCCSNSNILKNIHSVLITGAGSGLGREASIALAVRGHMVYAGCINTKEAKLLNEFAKKYKLDKRLKAFKLNILDALDRKKLLKIPFDTFISNAAIGNSGSIAEVNTDIIQDVFNTNVIFNIKIIQEIIKKWCMLTNSSLNHISNNGSHNANDALTNNFYNANNIVNSKNIDKSAYSNRPYIKCIDIDSNISDFTTSKCNNLNLADNSSSVKSKIKCYKKYGDYRIIVLSSLAGKKAIPFLGPYCISKFAIEGMCECLRKELKYIKEANISLCMIEPGAYATGFNKENNEKMFTWMKEKSYFKYMLNSLHIKTETFWNFIEVKPYVSIIQKYIDAVELQKVPFRLSEPSIQSFFTNFFRG